MMCSVATSAPADENLIRNPGFEVPAKDDGGLDGWGMPQTPGTRFSADTDTAHGGTQSARVDGLDPAAQSRFVQAWRQNVEIPGDRELWLTGWIKYRDITHARINILHKDKNGAVIQNQGLGDFEGTSDWHQFAGRLRRVPNAVQVQLVLGLQKSGGTVWFDDLYLGGGQAIRESLGTVTFSPSTPQVAGETVPVSFHIVLGDEGLPEGAELVFKWSNWRRAREFRLTGFSVSAPGTAKPPAVNIPPSKKTWPPDPQPVAFTLRMQPDAPLPPNAELTVHAKLRVTQHTNVGVDLLVGARRSPNALISPIGDPIPLRAVGGVPAALSCIAEARPLRGTPGRLTIAVTDTFGNPCQDFAGTVTFDPLPGSTLPADYRFAADDAGSHTFAVTVPPQTVSRIRVSAFGKTAVSNPILPRTADEPGVYFGDIHSHCELSGDAVGDPDQAYRYARNFFGLDFAGLSDHSPRGARWEHAMEVANRQNRPGRFVTLLGFEWSDPKAGHRNIYYRGDAGPDQPTGLKSNMTPWWDWLAEQDIEAVTIPHHTNTQAAQIKANGEPAWGPADWSVINHRYQRVVEICQNRGSFEVPGGPIRELRVLRKDCGASVQTALAEGHRLGFIGSTDTHSGRPGNGAARCAVLAAELSRTAVYDAIHNRTCYATTGPHIIVIFSVNQQPMGTEIVADGADAPRTVTWRAVGTCPIARVDLLRNNRVVRTGEPDTDDVSGRYTDDSALAEKEWWYLRVIQSDGNLAWSSPVWIDPADRP
jgi:hypothetical protein